jgi:hypothetical protein
MTKNLGTNLSQSWRHSAVESGLNPTSDRDWFRVHYHAFTEESANSNAPRSTTLHRVWFTATSSSAGVNLECMVKFSAIRIGIQETTKSKNECTRRSSPLRLLFDPAIKCTQFYCTGSGFCCSSATAADQCLRPPDSKCSKPSQNCRLSSQDD